VPSSIDRRGLCGRAGAVVACERNRLLRLDGGATDCGGGAVSLAVCGCFVGSMRSLEYFTRAVSGRKLEVSCVVLGRGRCYEHGG
jgi:hypothetical protein